MLYRLILVTLLGVAGAYVFSASNIPLDPWSEQDLVNARTLPLIYGGVFAFALLILLVRSFTSGVVVEAEPLRVDLDDQITQPPDRELNELPDQTQSELPAQVSDTRLKLAGLVVCAVIFVALLPLLGLWLSLALLLGASVVLLGERHWPTILISSVALPGIGWLLVEQVLGIVLPI